MPGCFLLEARGEAPGRVQLVRGEGGLDGGEHLRGGCVGRHEGRRRVRRQPGRVRALAVRDGDPAHRRIGIPELEPAAVHARQRRDARAGRGGDRAPPIIPPGARSSKVAPSSKEERTVTRHSRKVSSPGAGGAKVSVSKTTTPLTDTRAKTSSTSSEASIDATRNSIGRRSARKVASRSSRARPGRLELLRPAQLLGVRQPVVRVLEALGGEGAVGADQDLRALRCALLGLQVDASGSGAPGLLRPAPGPERPGEDPEPRGRETDDADPDVVGSLGLAHGTRLSSASRGGASRSRRACTSRTSLPAAPAGRVRSDP